MSRGSTALFIICIVQLLLLTGCFSNAQAIISQNFADVISVATQRYVHGKEWVSYMAQIGFVFSGDESCHASLEFPAYFNFTRSHLTLCYENSADSTRMVFNNLASKLLVETIRNQYNTTHIGLNSTLIPIDVSKGVFESMRDAVNAGTCEVAIAAVNWVDDRKTQVKFLCPYAASASGILRSEKDNSTISITNEKDMDQSGVIVSVVTKSTYETWAKSNLKLATVVSHPSFESAWQSVMNETSHTFLYNSNALYSRLKDAKATLACQSCFVRVYGSTSPFSSLISNQIYQISNAFHALHDFRFMIMFITLLLIVLQ